MSAKTCACCGKNFETPGELCRKCYAGTDREGRRVSAASMEEGKHAYFRPQEKTGVKRS